MGHKRFEPMDGTLTLADSIADTSEITLRPGFNKSRPFPGTGDLPACMDTRLHSSAGNDGEIQDPESLYFLPHR